MAPYSKKCRAAIKNSTIVASVVEWMRQEMQSQDMSPIVESMLEVLLGLCELEWMDLRELYHAIPFVAWFLRSVDHAPQVRWWSGRIMVYIYITPLYIIIHYHHILQLYNNIYI